MSANSEKMPITTVETGPDKKLETKVKKSRTPEQIEEQIETKGSSLISAAGTTIEEMGLGDDLQAKEAAAELNAEIIALKNRVGQLIRAEPRKESRDLQSIPEKAQIVIDHVMREISKKPESRDPDCTMSSVTYKIADGRYGDPAPVFKNLDEKLMDHLRQKFLRMSADKPGTKQLDVLEDNSDGFDLGILLGRSRDIEQLNGNRQEFVDKNNEFVITTILDSLKNASSEEISKRLSKPELNLLVRGVTGDLNSRIASGEGLPPQLEKKFVELLPLLEQSDEASKQYNAKLDNLPHKEKMQRDVRRCFFNGADQEESRSIIYHRLSNSRIPHGSYKDKTYEGYVALANKYGIKLPGKPIEEDELAVTF